MSIQMPVVTRCGEAGRQQPILGQGWDRQGPMGVQAGKTHVGKGGGVEGRYVRGRSSHISWLQLQVIR